MADVGLLRELTQSGCAMNFASDFDIWFLLVFDPARAKVTPEVCVGAVAVFSVGDIALSLIGGKWS